MGQRDGCAITVVAQAVNHNVVITGEARCRIRIGGNTPPPGMQVDEDIVVDLGTGCTVDQQDTPTGINSIDDRVVNDCGIYRRS